MLLHSINAELGRGDVDKIGVFPHLDRLKEKPFVFNIDFGLNELPTEPGLLVVRGARQYGKSTWLEQQLYQSIKQFGAGCAFYLNGEMLLDGDNLEKEITALLSAFAKGAPVKRIFVDEITSIDRWEVVLKRMVDRGQLADILVITTGSKAADLRRGSERLPGRKGMLARSNYLFTPIAYREFVRVCGDALGSNTLLAYLLSGGSPIACKELAEGGVIPEYVISLVRDWVEGEIALSGRHRTALLNIMRAIFRFGCTPIGQSKLARETGLANNTVASAYIEVLSDLGCVIPAYPWDQHRRQLILRKPCKYLITNLLVAVAYHPARVRRIEDFLALSKEEQDMWYEWLLAQELVRRASLLSGEILEPLAFWQNKKHEIDFVVEHDERQQRYEFIEMKRGVSNPLEFAWFAQQFPGEHLTVLAASQSLSQSTSQPVSLFETENVKAQFLHEFLMQV